MLVTAPAVSGAGCGKGLLVRAICAIAFGIRPRAFTTGGERHELDKRLAAELIEAQPALFLDNANGIRLRRYSLRVPARVRVLGQTRMVPLNSTAFIAVTGNGLTVTEDLARRFISCELDADAKIRSYVPSPEDFSTRSSGIALNSSSAVLTIWRWGRQKARSLHAVSRWGASRPGQHGAAIAVSLGCRDPVDRIEAIKAKDPRRQRIRELFCTWWEHHGAAPTKANDPPSR